MCLDKLDLEPRKRGGYGYKLLGTLCGVPHTCIQGMVELPIGKWVSDKCRTTRFVDGIGHNVPYTTGFHIFTSLASVEHWKLIMGWRGYPIFKVQYKNVVASGSQRLCKTVVARKIKVIEEVLV